MTKTIAPVAHTAMLIHKPVSEVFDAFVDPATTCKFWFTRGSKKLEQGAMVTWHWDMYGVSAEVAIKALEKDKRILIEWPTPVEWIFTARSDGTTFVDITASGFTGTDEEKVAAALDSMGGFSYLLAACKAYLEHGIELNLVADHSPDAHVAKNA